MKISLTITIAVLILGAQAGAQNFTGDAQAVGVAERSREALASFWFGKRFRRWSAPCPITVRKAASASGSTKMIFDRGEVFGWKMSVGARSREELDSTAIPHEVSHTVFASELRRPLPRWLDEGAAIYVESETEHERQREWLRAAIAAKRFTPFRELVGRPDDYPQDSQKLLNLYSEGLAIVSFLIEGHEGGRERFVSFLRAVQVDQSGASTLAALRRFYGYDSADALEVDWSRHWKTAGGSSCVHHACKAPHSAAFDPHLGLIVGDGRGAAGIAIRSPLVFGIAAGGGAACRIHFFTSSTCGPCQQWKRIELPKLGLPKSQFFTFEDDIAEMRRANVTKVPTFIVLHKGVERRRLVGYHSAAAVKALLGSCGVPRMAVNTPEAETGRGVSGPAETSKAEIDELMASVKDLRDRISEMESRPETPVVDLATLRRSVDDLRRRTERPIGVRIETSAGRLIREKVYPRGSPLVLRFDERLLKGSE